MKNCYIYIRTASFPQILDTENSTPIVNQIQACLAYAQQNKFEVLRIFEDLGVSGNTYSRPGLNELFESCRKEPVDALIVASADRTARSCSTFRLIKDKFKSLGVLIITAGGELLP